MKGRFSAFQAVMLGLFGAFAVAGVLIFAFVIGGSKNTAIGPVVIWGTLDQAAFNVVLRQLSETQSQLKQVTYVQKDERTYERELSDALASGAGPDVFILRQDFGPKDASKIAIIPFEQLSATQYQSTFVDAASSFVGSTGSLAVPLVVDPLVLYWNRDLLAASGFTQPPSEWNEKFYTFASDVSKRTQSNTIEKSAVAFGEYQNVQHAKDILSMLILQAGGAITAYDGAGKLIPALVPRTGESELPSQGALNFYTAFANPSASYYSWNRSLPGSRESFAAGDLALYIGYASEEPLLRQMNPNLNFGISGVPQLSSDPGAPRLTFAHVYGFAVPRAAHNPVGGRTVSYLLASPEASQLLSIALGIPSARRDVLEPQVSAANANATAQLLQPRQSVEILIASQALISRTWIDPDSERTEEIFRDMIENVTSGALGVQESVQRAEQALSQLINS